LSAMGGCDLRVLAGDRAHRFVAVLVLAAETTRERQIRIDIVAKPDIRLGALGRQVDVVESRQIGGQCGVGCRHVGRLLRCGFISPLAILSRRTPRTRIEHLIYFQLILGKAIWTTVGAVELWTSNQVPGKVRNIAATRPQIGVW